MRKLVLILIIVLVASSSVATASAGWFGDDVTVKDCNVIANHQIHSHSGGGNRYVQEDSNVERYVGGDVIFTIVPNTNFQHITNLYLENIVVTFEDGSVKEYNYSGLNYNYEDCDNIYFQSENGLAKDYIYCFYSDDLIIPDETYCMNSLAPSVDEIAKIKHIKADIVLDTTTSDHDVVGHLDNDVSVDVSKYLGR